MSIVTCQPQTKFCGDQIFMHSESIITFNSLKLNVILLNISLKKNKQKQINST